MKRFAHLPDKQWFTDFNFNIAKMHLVLNRPISNFHCYVDLNFADPQAFSSLNSQCWAELAKARAATLCSTCSGRSHASITKAKAI